MNNSNMNEGAFALVDCLGFKGIWRRTDPDVLMKKLLRIEKTIKQDQKKTFAASGFTRSEGMAVDIRLLSDTVAISVRWENEETRNTLKNKASLVGTCARTVSVLLRNYVEDDPPLVMRGCITYGEHICRGNFIAGPAVDQAAEHMNIADGAFVWLHPSAARLLPTFLENSKRALLAGLRQGEEDGKVERGLRSFVERFVDADALVIRDYPMPIKPARILYADVLNPFSSTDQSAKESTTETYRKVMQGDSLDVWIKRENTLKLLDTAHGVSEKQNTIVRDEKESFRKYVTYLVNSVEKPEELRKMVKGVLKRLE